MIIKSCLENGNSDPILETNGTFKVKILSSAKFQLNEFERKILEYLRRRVVTRREIEESFGVKESTARKYLGKLQKKGLVVKVGEGKKTKYSLAE